MTKTIVVKISILRSYVRSYDLDEMNTVLKSLDIHDLKIIYQFMQKNEDSLILQALYYCSNSSMFTFKTVIHISIWRKLKPPQRKIVSEFVYLCISNIIINLRSDIYEYERHFPKKSTNFIFINKE